MIPSWALYPRFPNNERIAVKPLKKNCNPTTVRYGYKDKPDVATFLKCVNNPD